MIWLLLACWAPRPVAASVSDCIGPGRDHCLAELAIRVIAHDPVTGVAALEDISDPEARLAAGGAIFADKNMVFDFATSKRICAALHDSYDEAFCQRRLGQGHLRGGP